MSTTAVTMSDPHGHATSTRRQATDTKLRKTVIDLLTQHGYSELTIELVAIRSGVAKTSIYRRWPSKAVMVFDIAIRSEHAHDSVPGKDLASDIVYLCEATYQALSAPLARAALPGLLADMTSNPALAEAMRERFIGPAQHDIEAVLEAAVKRGELAQATPATATAVQAALLGITYTWVHLFSDQIPLNLSDVIAASVFAAIPGWTPSESNRGFLPTV